MTRLVRELTDNKKLEKQKRKELQIKKAPQKSDRAKMIKIADKTSNLRSIKNSPPAKWSNKRNREYYAWALEVVRGCRGVNLFLQGEFGEAYAQGYERKGNK